MTKDWEEAFDHEFGIHFKDAAELQFVKEFIREQQAAAYTQGRVDEAKTCIGCKEARDKISRNVRKTCLNIDCPERNGGECTA